MRRITLPPVDPADAFAVCISKLRDKQLKARFEAASAEILAAAAEFPARSLATTLHQIPPDAAVGAVAALEMASLYDRNMAHVRASGRQVYDQIRAAAPDGCCPLCGHRDVSTLDHHLPKMKFAALAVVPANLIPACKDCNKTKGEHAPTAPANHTLHPYFDDVEGDTWLKAEVVPGPIAGIRFSVAPPPAWPQLTKDRIHHHFEFFHLAPLYVSNSARSLRMLRGRLMRLFALGGVDAVEAHLIEEADSWYEVNKNCWEAALFSALSSSEWYCNEGFRTVA